MVGVTLHVLIANNARGAEWCTTNNPDELQTTGVYSVSSDCSLLGSLSICALGSNYQDPSESYYNTPLRHKTSICMSSGTLELNGITDVITGYHPTIYRISNTVKYRLFTIYNGATLILRNLTISDGDVDRSGPMDQCSAGWAGG